MAIARRDYGLNGEETRRAREKGLVSAEWCRSQVPRARLRELMRRRNFPGLWHLFLWYALIVGFGVLTWLAWGTWWVVPAYLAYCTILTGSSDPRWHEFGHGTATAIPRLNDAVYRSPDDEFFATDGYCTHEQMHLAEGVVIDDVIECPKHNGRFGYRTGRALGAPVLVDLAVYPVRIEGGSVLVDIG